MTGVTVVRDATGVTVKCRCGTVRIGAEDPPSWFWLATAFALGCVVAMIFLLWAGAI